MLYISNNKVYGECSKPFERILNEYCYRINNEWIIRSKDNIKLLQLKTLLENENNYLLNKMY